MSSAELFWYGAAGALVTFIIVFVVPELMLVFQGKKQFKFDVGPFVAAIGLAAIFLAIGGFLTMTISGATTIKDAVFYGLGMETLTGGTVKGLLKP